MDKWSRRSIFSGIAGVSVASLAGCIGDSQSEADEESDTNDRSREDRVVKVAEYEAIPEDIPLEITAVELAPTVISTTGTAYLHIGAKNTHNPPLRGSKKVSTQIPYYKGYNDGTYQEERQLGVWHSRAPDRPTESELIACLTDDEDKPYQRTEEGGPIMILGAGKSFVESYIIGHIDGCFSPGNYRFRRDVEFWDGDWTDRDEIDAKDDPDATYEWGFTLEIA